MGSALTASSIFHYDLPLERIAQRPVQPPDAAKLLVASRSNGSLRDDTFAALPQYLQQGDMLVFNDTRVIPARLFGTLLPGPDSLKTARAVEVLLLASVSPFDPSGRQVWRATGRPLKHFEVGAQLAITDRLHARVIERPSSEEVIIEFESKDPEASAWSLIEDAGNMPIPPYIRNGHSDAQDRIDYQTIFAARDGSIAAPTASLHFTPALIERLNRIGVRTSRLTLHVGASSIRPVLREGVLQRPGHERMSVSAELLQEIAATKRSGGRVIGVGTTVARALETGMRLSAPYPEEVDTDLFITPGFKFLALDGLITNFHQPGTTHLLLVEAFIGRDLMQHVYEHALATQYRFLSYGDGMLLL